MKTKKSSRPKAESLKKVSKSKLPVNLVKPLRKQNPGGFSCALGMSELYRVEVPKCRRWRQAHSQRQGLSREVPTEGSPRQTIDLTNRNGLRHMLSGKTARQVEAQKPHGDGSVKTEGT